MSALTNQYEAFTSVTRISDDVTQIGLTSIDIGITVGDFVEVTGVGDTALFEGLKMRVTAKATGTLNLDWTDHSLVAPAGGWTIGGMIRLYQTPADCDESMRVSFNPHNISAITSATGDTGETVIDNVLNSNRGITHTLSGGSDHEIVPTVGTDSYIDSVALIDFRATKADGAQDTDVQIRIRGGGATNPVDVVYPIPERYTLSGRPALGYPGISIAGQNDNDPVPHAVFYIPAITADGTEKINIIDSNAGTDLEFSELLLCSHWTPVVGKNFDVGDQTAGQIIATDTLRGTVRHRRRDGLDLSRSVIISLMDENDCTYIDLMMKSGRTMIFDSYPKDDEKRWRTMIVGYLSGSISTHQLAPGNTVELNVIDSKLHEGI